MCTHIQKVTAIKVGVHFKDHNWNHTILMFACEYWMDIISKQFYVIEKKVDKILT